MSELNRPSPFVKDSGEAIQDFLGTTDADFYQRINQVIDIIGQAEDTNNPIPVVLTIASTIEQPTKTLACMFLSHRDSLPESWMADKEEIQRSILVLAAGVELAMLRVKLLGQAAARVPFRQRKSTYKEIAGLNVLTHRLTQEKN